MGIKLTRLKTDHESIQFKNNEIAIVGIGAKLPGCEDIDDFWKKLMQGEDFITDFPEERKKDIAPYLLHKGIKNEAYVQGAYLKEVDRFDYKFFGFSPREASLMNPLQRIFLQTAWECIEDAGYGGNKIIGSDTGVYIGYIADMEGSKYGQMIDEMLTEDVKRMSLTGNLASIIPSRLSYMLDLKGPSLLIDTACSSSLVAVHTACQAIKNGDCKQAIVGGVKVNFMPLSNNVKVGIESVDGHTKAFDDAANGTGIGEGSVVIFLKSYEQAKLDHDHIYAVIKGSAINQDGTSMGITAPNAKAQTELLIKAWKNAHINPLTLKYIEAHGTGTNLGDPIEVNGLNNAFAQYTSKKQFCGIGSIKSNMGHLYEAAGILSMLKAILILKNKQIPPTINFNKPNKKIAFEQSAVYLTDQAIDLTNVEDKIRCGVSSFGFSGTNCHIVLEEAERTKKSDAQSEKENHLITLSAKNSSLLKVLIEKYSNYLENHKEINLEALCYTANTGRGHYECRLICIVKSIEELRDRLAQLKEVELKDCQNLRDTYYKEVYVINEDLEICHDNQITELRKRVLDQEAKAYSYPLKTMSHEVLEQLCELYIEGATIDWEKLYENSRQQKISLPTYAFSKERCWFVERMSQSEDISIMDKLITGIQKINKAEDDVFKGITEVDEFAHSLLIIALDQMHITSILKEKCDIETLYIKLGISPIYKRLFNAIIDMLKKEEYIAIHDEFVQLTPRFFQVLDKYNTESITKVKEELQELYKDKKAYFRLLETCIIQYPNVLTGSIRATEVMFPNSSMQLVEDIYKGNLMADHFNILMQKGVILAINEFMNVRKSKEKIRILEIGAGTGGTSEGIFKALENENLGQYVEYCYTDISMTFTEYGKNKYGERYNFVTFKTLDIEKNIDKQEFNRGEYDIVIASNVIHATQNIANTTKMIRRLLKEKGILILNEITHAQDFTTLTFGLLDGWWKYEDKEIRMMHTPLLSEDKWKTVLESKGMKNVIGIGLKGCSRSIIIGENSQVDMEEYEVYTKERQHSFVDTKTVKLVGRNAENYSETEMKVAQVWKDILGFDEIDINENFFDIGGDSILVTNLYEQLDKQFPGIFTIPKLFNYSSISKMSSYIDQELGLQNDIEEETNVEEKSQEDIETLLIEMEKGTLSLDQVMNKITES